MIWLEIFYNKPKSNNKWFIRIVFRVANTGLNQIIHFNINILETDKLNNYLFVYNI